MGLSGGVDSTLSARLLQQSGYEVLGCYLKMFDKPAYHEQNLKKIRRVCEFLGVDLVVEELFEDFRRDVYEPFLQSYKNGKTPNPCALCNRNIKISKMIEIADKNSCDYVATGHYARTDGDFFYEAADKSKDQTYFLFYVKKEHIKRLIFPLNDMEKQQVKETVAKIQEITDIASQKESLDICFVEHSYKDVLNENNLPSKEGKVLDKNGKVIGTHSGYMHYTVGQRKGFSLFLPPDAPRYVLEIIAEKNAIVVGRLEDLLASEFEIGDCNFFISQSDFEADVKVRYSSRKFPCSVSLNGARGKVRLKDPVRAISPGQAAVFYSGDKLLGGGWII
ncbi:MAG: tRNA 2-thiouridine(34) synthase MnmA [Helicobacteraceae bacterium]